jgi:hypothetical protein
MISRIYSVIVNAKKKFLMDRPMQLNSKREEMNNPNDSLENKEVLIKLKRGSAPPIFLMEVEKEPFQTDAFHT